MTDKCETCKNYEPTTEESGNVLLRHGSWRITKEGRYLVIMDEHNIEPNLSIKLYDDTNGFFTLANRDKEVIVWTVDHMKLATGKKQIVEVDAPKTKPDTKDIDIQYGGWKIKSGCNEITVKQGCDSSTFVFRERSSGWVTIRKGLKETTLFTSDINDLVDGK